jgi:acyl-CoA dehydrogenase
MESIHFPDELTLLRDQIRRFVEKEVVPNGEAWEEAGCVPREVLRRMGELGFLGLRYPEKYGGAGANTLATVVLAEELGRSTFGGFSATVLVHTDMSSPHLARFGTAEQLDKYMPSIVSGETIGAIAVTEPDAGSDVAGIKTRAVRDGDSYVLNGSKMFITNGVHGDLYFVAAKTDPEARGARGISMFLVEKGTPGFTVGRALKKTGWWCSDTAELVFDNCRVPAGNLLGKENQGFYAIMQNFQNERLALGAQGMGESEKAIEITLEYVGNRKAFGASLWERGTIRQRLAMLWTKVQAGKQMVYHAAWLDAQGIDCVREVSAVKALCGELVNEVTYDCVQFHGGAGYLRESPIERMARDARVMAIGGGATEVMLEEVAKRMTN